MEQVGAAQVNIQTVYASKYVSNKAKGSVVWTPVKGEITLPLPGLMKLVVAPVVEGELEKLVEKSIDNLIKRFGGEV